MIKEEVNGRPWDTYEPSSRIGCVESDGVCGNFSWLKLRVMTQKRHGYIPCNQHGNRELPVEIKHLKTQFFFRCSIAMFDCQSVLAWDRRNMVIHQGI